MKKLLGSLTVAAALLAQVETPLTGLVFDTHRRVLLRATGEPGAMQLISALPDGSTVTSAAVAVDGRSAIVRLETPEAGLFRVDERGATRIASEVAATEVVAAGSMIVVRHADGLALLGGDGAIAASLSSAGGERIRSATAPLTGTCVYLLGATVDRWCTDGSRTVLAAASESTVIAVDAFGGLAVVSPEAKVIERYRQSSLVSRQSVELLPSRVDSVVASGGRLAIQAADSRGLWLVESHGDMRWVDLPFAAQKLTALSSGALLAAPARSDAPYLTVASDPLARPFFVPVN